MKQSALNKKKLAIKNIIYKFVTFKLHDIIKVQRNDEVSFTHSCRKQKTKQKKQTS